MRRNVLFFNVMYSYTSSSKIILGNFSKSSSRASKSTLVKIFLLDYVDC
jgi:hypothetical protein